MSGTHKRALGDGTKAITHQNCFSMLPDELVWRLFDYLSDITSTATLFYSAISKPIQNVVDSNITHLKIKLHHKTVIPNFRFKHLRHLQVTFSFTDFESNKEVSDLTQKTNHLISTHGLLLHSFGVMNMESKKKASLIDLEYTIAKMLLPSLPLMVQLRGLDLSLISLKKLWPEEIVQLTQLVQLEVALLGYMPSSPCFESINALSNLTQLRITDYSARQNHQQRVSDVIDFTALQLPKLKIFGFYNWFSLDRVRTLSRLTTLESLCFFWNSTGTTQNLHTGFLSGLPRLNRLCLYPRFEHAYDEDSTYVITSAASLKSFAERRIQQLIVHVHHPLYCLSLDYLQHLQVLDTLALSAVGGGYKQITASGLGLLTNLRNLRMSYVDFGLEKLSWLYNLEVLGINGMSLKPALPSLPRLTRLVSLTTFCTLEDCTVEDISHLTQVTSLTELSLQSRKSYPTDFSSMISTMTNLKVLNLTCLELSHDSIIRLGRLPNLKKLGIEDREGDNRELLISQFKKLFSDVELNFAAPRLRVVGRPDAI